MNEPEHDAAFEGRWHWNGIARRLTVDAERDSLVFELKGTWSQEGLALMLDGFSRNRLQISLSGAEPSVNCALNLSDGRRIQLVGAFTDESEARGIILSGGSTGSTSQETDSPGPALEPVFQPIFALNTGAIVGFEALARWRTGAEAIGAAHRYEDEHLAANMLIHAAEALAGWCYQSGRSDLFVHVNLTGRDLEDPSLVDLVGNLIDGFALGPGRLRLELTEQAALRDAGEAIGVARALKEAGAGLVLDDFGSGHSSFSWLADLPADGLKIDPALTRRIGEPRTDAILQSVSRLAHQLEMTITGEGVEAEWQAAALRRFGFDYAQGFMYSHPLSRTAAGGRLALER